MAKVKRYTVEFTLAELYAAQACAARGTGIRATAIERRVDEKLCEAIALARSIPTHRGFEMKCAKHGEQATICRFCDAETIEALTPRCVTGGDWEFCDHPECDRRCRFAESAVSTAERKP